MRHHLTALLALVLATSACGGDDDSPATIDADTTPPADAAPTIDATPPADATPDYLYRATVMSGNAQTVEIGAPLTADAVFLLTTLEGTPLANLDVTITPTPGVWVSDTTGNTDADGTYTVQVRAGRVLGANTLKLEAFATQPVSATFTVTDVPGEVISIVNPDRLFGILLPLGPLPAIATRLREPFISVADATGGFFVSDSHWCSVFHVNASGVLVRVAGSGVCGATAGNDAAATAAVMQVPTDLAYNATNNILYIADPQNHVVRAVALATGTITSVIGDGSGALGDTAVEGGTASAIGYPSPSTLAFAGGEIYVSNPTGHIIRVDAAGVAHDVMFAHPDGTTGCDAEPLRVINAAAGPMTVAAGGVLYFFAQVCGTGAGGSASHRAVIKRDAAGVLSWVAGAAGGGTLSNDGNVAFSPQPVGLRTDGATHLITSDFSTSIIRRVNLATHAVTLVIGSGGSSPLDYVSPGASGLAAGGAASRLSTGTLVIPDRDLGAVREIR